MISLLSLLSFEIHASENTQLNTIYLEAVEKKFYFDEGNDNIQNIFKNWFNSKLKLDGFSGIFYLKLSNYNEEVSNIEKGKKINLSIEFEFYLSDDSRNISKKFFGTVNSYSSITGFFNLKEVDNLIIETQINLVDQLSKKLQNSELISPKRG